MPLNKLQDLVNRLESNCHLGRKLIIVIGAGASRGIGAPSMRDIHGFIKKELANKSRSPAIENVNALLEALLPSSSEKADKKLDHPRSVMVRLYHLLQSSKDPEIQKTWKEFGIKLLCGQLQKGGTPFWLLKPSKAHYWAARLARSERAMLISLNFDGLTQKAIDGVTGTSGDRHSARILSTPEEILTFFANLPPPGESPIPLIKFRGDVFHAVCRINRCPELEKKVPLYDLLDRMTHEATGASENSMNHQEESSNKAKKYYNQAVTALRCPVCKKTRELEISFPGVFGKEEAIERAIHALHRVIGSSIGGVAFLGFSGDWDETLVGYLVHRAKEVNAPIFAFSRTEIGTLTIERAAERVHWLSMYKHVQYLSKSGSPIEKDDVLDQILAPYSLSEKIEHRANELGQQEYKAVFPYEAFIGLGIENPSSPDVQLQFTLPSKRSIRVSPSDEPRGDTFTGIAGYAKNSEEISRLHWCSQLGAKSAFLQESGEKHHTRFDHSISTCLLAMVWYEALQSCPYNRSGWAKTEEAKLALELAALYHDARHLPFSHMMEEIFYELNWEYAPQCYPDWSSEFAKKLQMKFRQLNGKVQKMLPKIWWESRVNSIQNGQTGIPWLDAIVDGALDVDKIEYVFHDAKFTGQNVRLSEVSSWMSEFLNYQSLTPEGLIRLEGDSALASLALLEERIHLYRRVYLAPELRGLEALVKYIVMTWLKWRVPSQLSIQPYEKAFGEEGSDWRMLKGNAAGELLWNLFNKDVQEAPKNELAVVGTMVSDLEAMTDERGQSCLDKIAIEWIGRLWSNLKPFVKISGGKETASRELARKKYAELAPIGPLYARASDESKIRKIIRRWRVHSPLLGIVDLVRFPKFLSTPNHRAERLVGGRYIFAEQFLVPGERPSEWRTSKGAMVPLHSCDFSSFELPVVQLIILDPWGDSAGGSAFLYQMLSKELKNVNVELYESPERAAKSAPLA